MLRAFVAALATVASSCAAEPTSRLTVAVRPHGPDGPAEKRDITCGGSPRAVSERLRALEPSAFAPVPPGQVRSQTHGGPATARVRGRLGREPVDARVILRNGCDIARWKRLAWLLGAPPR